MEYEIRTLDGQLALRERTNEDGSAAESRTIVGKAIAFDSQSEILYDRETDSFFREVISREAITQEWLNSQDVKLNMLHERNGTIARSNKGVGNLRMEVREDGVYFEFDAPKCDLGDRCLALVREGVYTGCSFEFLPGEYDKSRVREGETYLPLFTYRSLRRIGALTIGMDPAYSATDVMAREAAELMREEATVPAVDGEEEKREQELRDAIERERFTREQHLAAMQMRTRRRIIEHNNK